MVSVLFPSRFTIVRVVPAGDLVTVLVMDPAGFVRVIGAPLDGVMTELGPMALPIGMPPPLPRCAAIGRQTSKPSATIGSILLRICRPPLTSLANELVKEIVANGVPIIGAQAPRFAGRSICRWTDPLLTRRREAREEKPMSLFVSLDSLDVRGFR